MDLPDGETGGAVSPPGKVAVDEAARPYDGRQGPARTRRSDGSITPAGPRPGTDGIVLGDDTTLLVCPNWNKNVSYFGSRRGLSPKGKEMLTLMGLFRRMFGGSAIL